MEDGFTCDWGVLEAARFNDGVVHVLSGLEVLFRQPHVIQDGAYDQELSPSDPKGSLLLPHPWLGHPGVDHNDASATTFNLPQGLDCCLGKIGVTTRMKSTGTDSNSNVNPGILLTCFLDQSQEWKRQCPHWSGVGLDCQH